MVLWYQVKVAVRLHRVFLGYIFLGPPKKSGGVGAGPVQLPPGVRPIPTVSPAESGVLPCPAHRGRGDTARYLTRVRPTIPQDRGCL
jgi:hypothetical protein